MRIPKLRHFEVCLFALRGRQLALRKVRFGHQYFDLFFKDRALLKHSIPFSPSQADLDRKRASSLTVQACLQPLLGSHLKSGEVERSSERIILIQVDAAQ
jgi:hypothetical protein